MLFSGRQEALPQNAQEGEVWVFLAWKAPIDGGQVAAYKVQRRERPAGEWSDVATAMESEITVNGQMCSNEVQFRVIAMNKAGESEGQQQRHGGAVTCRRQLW